MKSKKYILSARVFFSVIIILAMGLPTMAFAGTIQLPKTGQTISYYEGDDGAFQAGVTWPSPRFTDHGDGTITDELTGLMWIKDETAAMTWEAALEYVKTLNAGSHTDWRLANVVELRSLVDYSQRNPSLPQKHPFTKTKALASPYWSSTICMLNSSCAWAVDFSHGSGEGFGMTSAVYVRAMRGGQCGLLSDSVICLPWTGQNKCYDPYVSKIACAGTGQDGEIQAGVTWPSPRFTDHGDGTITDELTGLMWIKDETAAMTWEAALEYVKTLNAGSHTDWRLPNVEELRSLVDYSQKNPSLPQGHPFTKIKVLSSEAYWSSTTNAADYYGAWFVGFSDGYVVSGGVNGYGKDSNFYVRAVRGGKSVPSGTSTILPTTSTSSISTTTIPPTTSSSSTTNTVAGGGFPCPAQTVLGERLQDLNKLRTFRNAMLLKTEVGKQYTALYYKHAPELSYIFAHDDNLKEKANSLIQKVMPAIEGITTKKKVAISEDCDTGSN